MKYKLVKIKKRYSGQPEQIQLRNKIVELLIMDLKNVTKQIKLLTLNKFRLSSSWIDLDFILI